MARVRRRHPHRTRTRRQTRPGHWHVRARVERFVEPSLLLLLRERPLHGYELIERLPEVAGEGRIDVGNLVSKIDALDNTTTSVYNVYGQWLTVTDPKRTRTRTYDAATGLLHVRHDQPRHPNGRKQSLIEGALPFRVGRRDDGWCR